MESSAPLMDQRQRVDWARSIRDPEAFASEQAALGQVWTLLGLTTDIPNDNDWIRCSLGGGSVFVQRFGSTIKGFENVCRHRFHPIRTAAKGSGLVRCAFHHWVYNQEGEAVGIPQCKKLFGTSPKELGARLRNVEIACCGVLIFGRFPHQASKRTDSTAGEEPSSECTTADPSTTHQDQSLEEFLGDAWPILRAMCREGIRPGFSSTEVKANWKLLVEITLEEYHAFAVHPTSFGKEGWLDPDEAYYPRFDPHSAFFYDGQQGDLSSMAADCQAGSYQPKEYRVLNFFPNFLVNHNLALHAWYVTITQCVPIDHHSTTVRSWFFQAPFKRPQASWFRLLVEQFINLWLPFFVGVFLRRIIHEDHVICEAMQVPAGSINESPILGREEQRIAWFREAYWEALVQSNR